MQGLRTCIYRVANLPAAIDWYTKAFLKEPYFSEPYYVGFDIGGFELGLQPAEKPTGEAPENILTYWGVEDIQAEYDRLLGLGATSHEAPTNVGGPLMVATVRDPWGNLIGLIFNPLFAVKD
jgi:lactoylglutathione lyase